jgi:hypothetical protein
VLTRPDEVQIAYDRMQAVMATPKPQPALSPINRLLRFEMRLKTVVKLTGATVERVNELNKNRSRGVTRSEEAEFNV